MKKALVVEDELQVRKLLVAFLETTGKFSAIDDFATAEETLEVFKSGEYSIALIDVGLGPEYMHGVDLAVEINKADPKVLLICVTGHGDLRKECNLGAAGFGLCFVKPIEYKKLLTYISLYTED